MKEKCEPAAYVLTSNPPQYRCIYCSKTWFCKDETPDCPKQIATLTSMPTIEDVLENLLKEFPDRKLTFQNGETVREFIISENELKALSRSVVEDAFEATAIEIPGPDTPKPIEWLAGVVETLTEVKKLQSNYLGRGV